jgi:phosphoribosylanthranilate isomerase
MLQLVKLSPYAVDASSGVESAPGVKDIDKIVSFIRNTNS